MKRRHTPTTMDLAAFRFTTEAQPARDPRRALMAAGLILLAIAIAGAAALQGLGGALA
jgi:hypothetical protein